MSNEVTVLQAECYQLIKQVRDLSGFAQQVMRLTGTENGEDALSVISGLMQPTEGARPMNKKVDAK